MFRYSTFIGMADQDASSASAGAGAGAGTGASGEKRASSRRLPMLEDLAARYVFSG